MFKKKLQGLFSKTYQTRLYSLSRNPFRTPILCHPRTGFCRSYFRNI